MSHQELDRHALQRAAQAQSDELAAPQTAGTTPLARALLQRKLLQRRRASTEAQHNPAEKDEAVHAAAAHGTSGSAEALPFQDQIQRSFGAHDISQVQAHTGSAAREGAAAMGAEAFAAGDHVAFAGAPTLHTAAHEAAHVVQQRAGVQLKGGVGEAGDEYERHADAVADRVVQGQSAADLLSQMTQTSGGARGPAGGATQAKTAVQRDETTGDTTTTKGGETGKDTEPTKKDKAPVSDYPKVIDVGTEKVNVTTKEEELEAKTIIEGVKTEYGIDIRSSSTVDAIKTQYDKVPETVKNGLKTKQWEMKELRALKKALDHYAPILGAKRAQSTRKDAPQEVTSAGKVDQAIDSNSSTGALDTTTLGEYFKGSKNFGMFTAGTGSTVDFTDNLKQLEATAVHELAHGLMANEYDNFVAKGSDGFWTDQTTKSGKSGAEEPPTAYGKKNAREDLCESVMYYFVEEATLLTKCPKRHAFIKAVVTGWKAVAQKQEGQKAKNEGAVATASGTTNAGSSGGSWI